MYKTCDIYIISKNLYTFVYIIKLDIKKLSAIKEYNTV